MENTKKNVRKEYKYVYIGETNRTAYERGREHMEDLMRLDSGSHLLKHLVNAHPGLKPSEMKIGMRVVGQHRTALERQVGEAVKILNAQKKGQNLLNSKSEFNRCKLPRLYVGDAKDMIEEEKGEEIVEKKVGKRLEN